LTIIEMVVVVAVSISLLAIAAPSLSELVATQRLRSINAELVTDLQYARSSAISRNHLVRVRFGQTSTMSCYVVFIPGGAGQCDCTLPPGDVCRITGTLLDPEEIRTTVIPASTDVQVTSATNTSSGALVLNPDGLGNAAYGNYEISTSRISGSPGRFRVVVNMLGRPTVCFSSTASAPTC
jgi:type IV fimbrial biogenesis protein FimT